MRLCREKRITKEALDAGLSHLLEFAIGGGKSSLWTEFGAWLKSVWIDSRFAQPTRFNCCCDDLV